MLLKTANGRYLDSGHVVGFAPLGADTTWFIRAYLAAANSFDGSSSDFSQLAGTFASEAAVDDALAKLASLIGGFDTTDLE